MFALCSRTDIFLFDLFFHTSAIFRVGGGDFYPRAGLISTSFFPLSTSQKACSCTLSLAVTFLFPFQPQQKKSANWIFTTSQPWNLWLYFHYRCYSWGMYCHRLLGDVQTETFQWAAGSGMCSYRAQPCTHQSVGALSDTGCSRYTLNILSQLRGE